MTTAALIWWIAVLGTTWGLVVMVRAWRWSPGQDDPSELRSRHLGARLALLPVGVLLALALLLSLSLLGWSLTPPGWSRFRETLPILAACALTGVGVVACLRTMAGRGIRSWWLLAGLLPAVAGAALALGG
jgi:hypothetical protein